MTMGQRSGVGLVELAILEELDARRAWPGRRAVPCRKVLAALEDELGLARGYAYQVLIDLALPWQLPVPLVEGQGNFGGRGKTRRPARITPRHGCPRPARSRWPPSAARSHRSRSG
jgi:hypothetical protein